MDDKLKDTTKERHQSGGGQPNEGEGSRTAAQRYGKSAQRFIKSGKVDEHARAAREAVESEEGRELEQAEAIGRAHSKGEDPQIKR
jgi:hypothetical protein